MKKWIILTNRALPYLSIIIPITLLVLAFTQFESDPKPGYLIQGSASELSPAVAEVVNLVSKVNQHNSNVRTFECKDVDISIKNKQLIKVNAVIRYEKDKLLRMLVSSFLGKELDIGSNESIFWFWSRRMNPPALYFAHYEDLSITGLKTPFHPIWMKSTLGFDNVDINLAFARKRGENWEIISSTHNLRGSPVVRVTIIDPNKLSIIGHYIYEHGNIVVSSEVYEHILIGSHYVPKKMVIKWYEEDITMRWTLNDPKINTIIPSASWVMPQYHRTIDMSNN